jgi:DHA2 family multidrug resistance protein
MFKFLKVLAIYLIIFTQMLDTSIANLALTTISADLYMDVFHSSFIMTSIGTGLVISFSLGNLLKPYLSNDAMLSLGCVMFIFASYFCGNAQGSTEFLIFRFIQGLSSGLAIIVAQSLMLSIMGEERKAFAISLWVSAISLAPVLGPVVGAYITEYLSWRWLFLINVPLMSLSLFILLPAMTIEIKPKPQHQPGKLLTLLCFATCIASLQYTVDFGEFYQWFNSQKIQVSSLVTIFSALMFLLSNGRFPLFDFSIFKVSGYPSAIFVAAIGNGVIFSSLVFLPVWLQGDYGMPMLEAGLIIAVASAIAAVATPLIGKYLPKDLYAPAATLSLLLTAASFAMMSQFTTETSHQYLIISRFVAGLGLAIFTMPLAALSLKNVSAQQMINANAISITLRILSANLFVTIGFIAAVHQSRFIYAQSSANIDRISILNAMEQPISGLFGYQMKLARTEAMGNMFMVSGAIFFVFSMIILPYIIKQYRHKSIQTKVVSA